MKRLLTLGLTSTGIIGGGTMASKQLHQSFMTPEQRGFNKGAEKAATLHGEVSTHVKAAVDVAQWGYDKIINPAGAVVTGQNIRDGQTSIYDHLFGSGVPDWSIKRDHAVDKQILEIVRPPGTTSHVRGTARKLTEPTWQKMEEQRLNSSKLLMIDYNKPLPSQVQVPAGRIQSWAQTIASIAATSAILPVMFARHQAGPANFIE